ncbi:hypothetical protein PATSB16_35320 [Pandoraea thiooxydans]|nr:hypothetical protein PATSB16_35320 [Pandoraea thiooxydans]
MMREPGSAYPRRMRLRRAIASVSPDCSNLQGVRHHEVDYRHS